VTSSPEIPQPVIPDEAPPIELGSSDLVISISPITSDGVITVSPSGELDLDAAPRVRAAVTGAARARNCRRLVIDLDEVSFVDSTGLGALVAGFNVARSRGVAYSVINPQPAVRRALDITGLSGPFGLGITAPRQPPA
jgi:anti-sigma B factor antagonist